MKSSRHRSFLGGLLAAYAAVLASTAACQPDPGAALHVAGKVMSASAGVTSTSRTVRSSGITWGRPVFVEGFDGTVVNTHHWSVYNAPTAMFPRSASRVRVRDGELQITGGADAQGRDMSGGVSNDFAQLYGRWEARFRVDRGSGYSAVVLLWPKSEKWPADGEIDMIEVWDGARVHAGVNIHNGPHNRVVGSSVAADFTRWHTIAVDWLPTGLSVYLDTRKVFSVTAKAGAPGVNPVPSTSPMHIALQLDKGCVENLPCRTKATPAKVVMHVGSVRIFRYPG